MPGFYSCLIKLKLDLPFRQANCLTLKSNMALVLHKCVDLKIIDQRDEESINYPFV